jgi:transposase
MKKFTVGIDVSKDKIDFCILKNLDHAVVSKGIVNNCKNSLSKWLKQFDHDQYEFSLEHTGNYGAMLAFLLSEKQFCFYMINPISLKKSMGIQRGKTDVIDAYRIASFTIGNKHRLVPYQLPDKELRKIKALMTARERYVKISVQLKNSLKGNEILNKTIDIALLIKDEKRQIKSIKKAIEAVEKQIMEIINSSEVLYKSYQKITKVIGVGPITAVKCITETNNFLSFSNARKFSCYCGLAPFPYQSGSSIKGKSKTHFMRNKPLKATFFKAAGSAIQHDPQLKKYYHRKLGEGKHKLTVINAVANKLVLRIFAVVNRNEPFVKLAA